MGDLARDKFGEETQPRPSDQSNDRLGVRAARTHHDADGRGGAEKRARDEREGGHLRLEDPRERHPTAQRRNTRQRPREGAGKLERDKGPEHSAQIRRDGLGQARRLPPSGEEGSPRDNARPNRECGGAQRNIGPTRDQNANAESKREEHVHDGLPDRVNNNGSGGTARRGGWAGGGGVVGGGDTLRFRREPVKSGADEYPWQGGEGGATATRGESRPKT